MDNVLYNVLSNYFNQLCNTGYVKEASTKKVVALAIIQELLNKDFRGLINEEDYNMIVKTLYCLFGSDCLIPYPDYYSGKNKRIMYTGSLSELTHRIEEVEGILTVLDNDVVIPGDEGIDTGDFDVTLTSEPEDAQG